MVFHLCNRLIANFLIYFNTATYICAEVTHDWEMIIITELMTLWVQPWLIPTTGLLDPRSYRGMEK